MQGCLAVSLTGCHLDTGIEARRALYVWQRATSLAALGCTIPCAPSCLRGCISAWLPVRKPGAVKHSIPEGPRAGGYMASSIIYLI